MARFIRWQGLVAFIVLSALIAGLLYFFAETLVKKALISTGESTFGAEVNIDDVKLAYSPLQIQVLGLQVTDKDLPTHNVFSFDSATAGVEVWQYLFGKIIVDKLEVSQLAFSGVREKEGEVYVSESDEEASLSDKAKDMLPDVDMTLPDPKTLLEDSNLLTVKAAETLQASYQEEQAKLKALKDELPSKEKIKYYQDKVKALSEMDVKTVADIQKVKSEYDAIKAEFKSDQALIKTAKEKVLASKNLLAQQISDLKNAPAQDWQQIEKTYQLESLETEDFAHMIFGEQARDYVQKAQWVYEKVSPFMGGESSEEVIEEKVYADGRFIYFNEDNPLPAVLIKEALFSMTLEQGDFIVEGAELTHQHWVRGKDSTLNVSSMTNGEFTVSTNFNINQAGSFAANGKWLVKNRALTDTQLTESSALTLSLEKANLNGQGDFTLGDNNISAANHFALDNTTYQGNASSKVTNLLLDTMKSLNDLTIDVAVDGEVTKPGFSIESSLTDALTGAVKQQVAGKVDEFKATVNDGLNEKLASALKLGENQQSELLDLEALLTDSDNALDDLKNSDVVKQQQEKLENKAKDKVKDKLKDKLGSFLN